MARTITIAINVTIIAILLASLFAGAYVHAQDSPNTIRELADHGARINAAEKLLDNLNRMQIADRITRLETLVETIHRMLSGICIAMGLMVAKEVLHALRKRNDARLIT